MTRNKTGSDSLICVHERFLSKQPYHYYDKCFLRLKDCALHTKTCEKATVGYVPIPEGALGLRVLRQSVEVFSVALTCRLPICSS